MSASPVILWLRRDLRLSDNPALTAALETGAPLIPVFVLDPETEALAAAPKWRLGLAIDSFAKTLATHDSRLILRRGAADRVLCDLAAETGAREVHWTTLHDKPSRDRDAKVEKALKNADVRAVAHHGHTLHHPDAIATKTGGYYKVYTPFWNALRGKGVAAPAPSHRVLHAPSSWPASDKLADWNMGAAMRRGAAVVAPYTVVGEAAAAHRFRDFMKHLPGYTSARDDMGHRGTSGLSENLTYGEIGPRTLWHAGMEALHNGTKGAELFLKELAWRDFAHHLIWHTPHLPDRPWREEWNDFAWRRDNADAEAWRQGRTGEPIVDAAMRELFITGTMHNRARMIVASYLTKHLLVDWRVGLKWFEETLIDWDPASNALNWQWVAGSGPDASPYFRVFNPATQADKFDKKKEYRSRWLAEGERSPAEEALSFYDAAPRAWGLDPKDKPPTPLIDLKEGRERALQAYADLRG
ncbi:deoxyribodipyrimidine photo-lyase [Falsirhodobacter sp. alg1]|uniref:cryptochrome/photolyase family protein n=1 Tax=Falsirhodobacter sp. alg1 TaxID=1472418 RepID=UPI000787D4D2|nr:deoxyribodipyrimidine photo-lyase [Falsirhodobacter sp. alg1]